MSAILERLATQGLELPTACALEGGRWIHPRGLSALPRSFFKRLVPMHQVLLLEYSVHCARLAHAMSANIDALNLAHELEAALQISELLSHLYQHYLIVPREVARLAQEQQLYRQLLRRLDYQFDELKIIEPVTSPTRWVRDLNLKVNPPRLLIVRLKRTLSLFSAVIPSYDAYRLFVSQLDRFFNPIFSQLSWIAFCPRLIVNLGLLLKHALPWPQMTKEERSLGFMMRCRGQLERRWFEIGNDLAWLMGGLLNCFVLTGPLSGYAFYVSYALQIYDIVLASMRAYIELSRLTHLKHTYEDFVYGAENAAAASGYFEHLRHLELRIDYERERLFLSIAVAVSLSLSLSLLMPLLSAWPVLPFMGAAFTVLISISGQIALKMLDKIKPNDNVLGAIQQYLDAHPCPDTVVEMQVPAASVSAVGLFRRRSMIQSFSDGNLLKLEQAEQRIMGIE